MYVEKIQDGGGIYQIGNKLKPLVRQIAPVKSWVQTPNTVDDAFKQVINVVVDGRGQNAQTYDIELEHYDTAIGSVNTVLYTSKHEMEVIDFDCTTLDTGAVLDT